jgi:S1-C subfamily serine protease
VQGTGFVYAPQHVLTNAHVVAGVTNPTVSYAHDTHTYGARVVTYDPDLDVAVLYVPDLDPAAPRLRFAPGALGSGDDAVVIGFPEGGPFDVEPARVRGKETVRGPNIYQDRRVTREIYAIRSQVRPGNSGGPLLTPAGGVEGVVFAASYDDRQTGYALTNATVLPEARAAAERSTPVSTGGCTTE